MSPGRGSGGGRSERDRAGQSRLVIGDLEMNRRDRQRETEAGAAGRGGFGPDAAAVLLDDQLAEGQPEAGARTGAVALDEALENALAVLERDARAVVANHEVDVAAVGAGPEGHLGARSGVLVGV